MLHQKRKGSIGEQAVILDLLKQDIAVFTEIGDLSRIDLIAIIDNIPIRIQVKARTPSTNNNDKKHSCGVIDLKAEKSGPNYRYHYTQNDFDILAVYDLESDKIAYISVNEFLSKQHFSIRVKPAKNNQKTNIKMFSDYSDIRKALKYVEI